MMIHLCLLCLLKWMTETVVKLCNGGQEAVEVEQTLDHEAAVNADTIAERAARETEEKRQQPRAEGNAQASHSNRPQQQQQQKEEEEEQWSLSTQTQNEQQRKLDILRAGGYNPAMAQRRAVQEALSSLRDHIQTHS